MLKRSLLMMCVLLAAGGCKKLAQEAMKQATKAGQPKAETGGLFEDASALPGKFGAKLGGTVKFLELNIHPGYAGAQIQDPRKRENVDSYEFRRGEVTLEGPVKFIGRPPTAKDLDFMCVDAATMDFTAVPKIVKDAVERVKIEGGHVSHIIFKRNLPFNKNPVWRVYVDGERRSGSAEYDMTGAFKKVY